GYGVSSKYEVQRYTSADGSHLTEVTMKVHLKAGEGVTPADIARVQAEAAAGVDHYYNSGHVLPDGDHLNVKVEFVDDAAQAHLVVDLNDGEGHANQSTWYTEGDAQSTVHAHELGHQMGFLDEYFDPESRFRSDPNSPDIARDGSLMGNFWDKKHGLFGDKTIVRDGTGIRERHLQQLHDDIQRSRYQYEATEWQRLYNEGTDIANGKGPYASLTQDERNTKVTEINNRINEVKARFEEAQAAVNAAAARDVSAAERARQVPITKKDFAELLSTEAVKREQEAALRDANTELRRLQAERDECAAGGGVWEHATEEQRAN